MGLMETIEHDGLTLAALVAGDRNDPALVLLHGWPHSKEAYDEVIDALAARHRVIAFDLPGIGDSIGLPTSAEKIVLADILLGAAEAPRIGDRNP
jgi:pimeloyl-ACP methyl ester carboxylesterase